MAAISSYPAVIKADGLAAGKGVVIAEDESVAHSALVAMIEQRQFGDHPVLVEEFLRGDELSVLALCDGERALPLAPARDFKRIGDGDTGPNTGGMGAYSPVPRVDDVVVADVMDRFVGPTLAELRRRGIDYRGVLYAGLMLTPAGPRLVEYNVRFGDPEAQVVLPRLTTDLADLLAAAAGGDLTAAPPPAFDDGARVTVVLASEGYPAAPRTGDPIAGLAEAEAEGATVFCAGVAAGPEGGLVTAGGRVLSVTGAGPTVADAREAAYRAAARISWPGLVHRTDIALEASR
jgi:phosphoribosylamine--glycine ligase